MRLEEAKLLEQIHAAFPNELIKGKGAFGAMGTTYPDAEPYMRQLEGKTWDQLDREYIFRRNDALAFLDTRHLIAVLPAYLRGVIEEGTRAPTAGMLILILRPPRREKSGPTKTALPSPKYTGLSGPRFRALIDALTGEQRAAVACVLCALGTTDPDSFLGVAAEARTALEEFWKTYLPAGA